MTKEEILLHLKESCPWQDSLLWFDSIESTNTRAKELAACGAPQGTVLIADCQTGGRGSRGRSFHSPKGMGIYMSVILRPHCKPAQLMHLTCATAAAMCDAVERAAGIRPRIKWTNDLVCGDRKFAGILTELALTPQGDVDYVVIGIGINCLQKIQDFPEEIRGFAGSLQSITGNAVDRNVLAAEMVHALWRMSETLLTGQALTLAQYRKDCITLGKEVSIVKADGIAVHATAMDIDSQGALLVRLENGDVEAVSSGEVSVRGMYGYL